MTSKRERQRAIREIVEDRPVASQEELRVLLRERGWEVTQSTLSRDLHELRLARVPTADGVRYAFAESGGAVATLDRGALDFLLPQFFDRMDGTAQLLVLHTVTGGAQPIAAVIGSAGWHEILGTIAGDDTILIVCRSEAAREKVERKLEEIATAA